MKIRFIETLSTASGAVFRRGRDYDLPNDQANHYVQSGIATKTPEPIGNARPSTAMRSTDPASLAAAAAFEGNAPPGQPEPQPLSSANPPPETTTAVPRPASDAPVGPLPVGIPPWASPLPAAPVATKPAAAKAAKH